MDNGGSAFPEVQTRYEGSSGEYTQYICSAGGMTLRDYFAAKAMQGMLALGHYHRSEVSRLSYEMADNMLAERAK